MKRGKVTFSTRTVHGSAVSAPSGDATTMASGTNDPFWTTGKEQRDGRGQDHWTTRAVGDDAGVSAETIDPKSAVAVPPETPRPDLRALIAKWRNYRAKAADVGLAYAGKHRGYEAAGLCEGLERCISELEAALSVESVPPAPKPKSLITDDDRERMKKDSHFDPLRPLAYARVKALREAADRIWAYLSSPSQCVEETVLKIWEPLAPPAPKGEK